MKIAKSEESPSGGIGVTRKRWWQQALRWQYLGLCILVIATLALHFSIIMMNTEPVFDESSYVDAARSIISGTGDTNHEHPPLGKLFVVSGILVFGDNPLGWRFFSVIFGTAAIVLFYFICRKLAMSQRATLLATFLFALDVMNFEESSLALLDVYMMTFMMAGFLLYLHKSYLLSGILLALSALAKLTGGLALIAIILHWVFTRRDKPKRFWASAILAPVSFVVFMFPLYYFASGTLANPIERTINLLRWSSSLTFATRIDPSASRPWEWILSPESMPFGSSVSFTIWALIIPAAIYIFYRAKQGNNAASFGLAWFAATYLTWIPLSLVTNRISYPYYFYPTIGAICIGIGLGLCQLLDITKSVKLRRAVTAGIVSYLLLHLAIFIIFCGFARLWLAGI